MRKDKQFTNNDDATKYMISERKKGYHVIKQIIVTSTDIYMFRRPKEWIN
jgi:hypothetical protein